MKNILAALMLCIGTAVFAQSSNTIDITINGQTSREQLAQMRKDLQAQGILFNYAPQFDNQRRLTAIQYKVSTADNVQIGEGGHSALQQTGAAVTFHVNAAAKSFAEEKK
ncbi:MAG: hypothetical protein ACKO7B_18840 [Flavobacteriales bacterium]